MDVINSQNLTHFDSYLHKFTSPGRYQWGLSNIGQNVINVTDPPNAVPQQVTVSLTWDGKQFQISAPNIDIKTNDIVLWNNSTAGALVPTYSIVGTNFNSRSLTAGEVFSHWLQMTGDYKYVITGLTGGPQYGNITVLPPPNPMPHQRSIVTVADGTPPAPNPPTPPIYVGDLILWNVVSGSGIAIKTT